MNFLKKIFNYLQDKDENTASMNNTVLSITNVDTYNSGSTMDDSVELNTENHSEVNLHYNKLFSDYRDSLFKDSYSINNTDKLVDFEELIDRTRQEEEFRTAHNIKEFEDVLNNFKTEQSSNVKDLKGDIDFLDDLHVSIDSVNLDIQNNKCSTNSSGDFIENINIDDIKEDLLMNVINKNDPESALIEAKDEVDSDIISEISVNEKLTMDEDGYNSSDFEFITETEAKIDGYIYKIKSYTSKTNNNDLHMRDGFGNLKSENSAQSLNSNNRSDLSLNSIGIEVDPGEGPSGLNRPIEGYANREYSNMNLNPEEDSSGLNRLVDYSKRECRTNPMFPNEDSDSLNEPFEDYSNREYRDKHIVPEGDEYLDLFQGQNNLAMPLSQIILLENKSIRPLHMNSQYEGIGFDAQLIGRRYELDSSEEEYEEEANESIKKIKLLYPGENRFIKRRRY